MCIADSYRNCRGVLFLSKILYPHCLLANILSVNCFDVEIYGQNNLILVAKKFNRAHIVSKTIILNTNFKRFDRNGVDAPLPRTCINVSEIHCFF